MRIFHTVDKTILLILDKDITNMTNYRGVGIDILILPNKYYNVRDMYLDEIIHYIKSRSGEIIYC